MKKFLLLIALTLTTQSIFAQLSKNDPLYPTFIYNKDKQYIEMTMTNKTTQRIFVRNEKTRLDGGSYIIFTFVNSSGKKLFEYIVGVGFHPMQPFPPGGFIVNYKLNEMLYDKDYSNATKVNIAVYLNYTAGNLGIFDGTVKTTLDLK